MRERDDLLARRPDATDRRATLVELTPAGRALIDDMHAYYQGIADTIVSPLSPQERHTLFELIERIRVDGLGEPPGWDCPSEDHAQQDS